jgi:signal transduction histidine kinase
MATLNSVPGAGLLVDAEYTIAETNNRCDVVFKQSSEEIRGESLRTLQNRGLFDEATRTQWERAASAVMAGETDARTEQITLRPGGNDEAVHYDLRVVPSEHNPDAARCSLRSVGTSQRYEETLTALHVSTRELMDAGDVDAVLRRTAEAASDVLGFPGTAVRRYDEDSGLLHHVAFGGRVGNIDTRPSYDVDESPHGRAVRRGETVIDSIDADDPYGRDDFTQTLYTPIGDVGLLSIGTVGSTFDETDVQFAEILAENAAAAVRVVETAARLRKERERLDRFASVISHDLRSPLTIATLSLERARQTGDEADFETVADSLERMDRMTDDLLTLARSSGPIEDAESADLQRLTRNAWETIQTGDATLVCDSDGIIECEPSLVRNLLENLVRNAVEHNDTPVTVRVGMLDDRDDGPGGFYVADDGRGIPESDRETVLEHGFSSDGGTGLGLSIVRDITDAHGWEIAVTEGRDGGARFEIRTGA